MTEDRLSSLLQEFADPIVARSVVSAPPLRLRTFRLGLAGVGLATACLAGFVLIPGIARAATLRRIDSAIKNASSMIETETVYDLRPESGKAFNTIRYRSGMWRYDVVPGLTREVHSIERDGYWYKYAPHLNLVTKEPVTAAESAGELSAVEYAKSQVDFGDMSVKRQVRIESRPPVDGKAVYAVVLERSTDNYRSDILVDSRTDLPIRAVMTETAHNGAYGNIRQRLVIDYRFNEPIPDSLYDPHSFGLPIHDLESERAALVAAWTKPLATFDGSKVLHTWRDSGGKIYVACLVKDLDDAGIPSELTDDRGTIYLHAPKEPYIGAAKWGAPGEFVAVSVWVPLEPFTGGVQPAGISLSLGQRVDLTQPVPDGRKVYNLRKTPSGSKPTDVLNLPVPPTESGREYITALGLDEADLQLDASLDAARAEWYSAKRQYEDELRWRWSAYRDMEKDLPRGARIFYAKPIAACLRKLGRAAEADKVLAEYGEPAPKTAP
jgi:hypothetical protein